MLGLTIVLILVAISVSSGAAYYMYQKETQTRVSQSQGMRALTLSMILPLVFFTAGYENLLMLAERTGWGSLATILFILVALAFWIANLPVGWKIGKHLANKKTEIVEE